MTQSHVLKRAAGTLVTVDCHVTDATPMDKMLPYHAPTLVQHDTRTGLSRTEAQHKTYTAYLESHSCVHMQQVPNTAICDGTCLTRNTSNPDIRTPPMLKPHRTHLLLGSQQCQSPLYYCPHTRQNCVTLCSCPSGGPAKLHEQQQDRFGGTKVCTQHQKQNMH